MNPEILIAIPAYNEADFIGRVLCDIKKKYPHLKVLVVNDGSTDGTRRVLQKSGVSFIEHSTNIGKGQAILTAVQYAKKSGYDWILTLDADGQHDVSRISRFINKIKSDRWDVILGNRMGHRHLMPLHRVLSNGITSIIVSLCSGGPRIKDSQCGFRAIRLGRIQTRHFRQKGFQFESEMLLKLPRLGARITHVSISTIYADENSSMALVGDTLKFIRLILQSFWWN